MAAMGPAQAEAPFIPAAVIPPQKDPPSWLLAARTPFNQIEGWPRAVFEGDAYRPPFPGMPLFLAQPQAIRTVLLDAAQDFPQGELLKRMMRPAWGRGLFTAEDRDWRWQRRATAPAFRPAEMAGLAPLVSGVADKTVEGWTGSGQTNLIDIPSEMTRLTFEVILDTMLSGGEDFDRAAMQSRIKSFIADIGRMRVSYFLAPDAYHASRPDARSAHRQPLLNDIRRMVSRRRGSASRPDLVDLLLQARDPETGQGMDDDLLANNLLGFIVAGHETTALALTWALYLVAMHPPTAARIRDEVTKVAGTNAIDATHVDRLVFTRQVLSETLRLYPPGIQLTRVSRKRTELAGFPVQAGSRVIIPVYALHRHRGHWANPDAFDPDRFAPSAPQPDRFTYLPFGAGPRICLGAAFAMMEAVTVLASLVRAIDFTVVSPHRVRPVARLALRPAGGLPMSVRRIR